jgi:hypothetical protein
MVGTSATVPRKASRLRRSAFNVRETAIFRAILRLFRTSA